MRPTLLGLFVIAGATTVLLSGCGNSSSTPEAKSGAAAPPPSAPQAVAPAAPAETASAVTPATAPATAPAEAAQSAVSDAGSQLAAMAKTEKDPVLSSVGTELSDKVNALTASAPGNTTLKSQLASSVESLAGGKDSSALASFYQAAQAASLTPQQTQLAKDLGNVATAFVVQRNFSSLEGAQTDVATIVSSLRKGEITAAAPAIQKVASNANLTPSQKDLIASVADKYAPGLTKASGTVQQGLQNLRNLSKP